MSRTRFAYALACVGILITTGGCGSSATAPEAATADRAAVSADRTSNPAAADSGSVKPAKDDNLTIQSGYISVGN